MIPHHTKYQIDEYVNDKMPPGDFLYAVLTNNLAEAVFKADDTNLFCLKDIVLYVYNHIPSVCWGTPEKVEEWLNPQESS
jgi:hypothetical protein